ncbi:MAG: diacylglycerol kinase family protein [Paracoccaceae bacterium]
MTITDRICLIANPGSGRNSRDAEAIHRALDSFGPRAELREWSEGQSLEATVKQALADGFGTLVAAGGDGTVMGVAQAMTAANAPRRRMAVLPLGTFNYFARGLGLPEDPEAAAQAILGGSVRPISVGTVNGQVFLNNASLGIYPSILKAREAVYERFGRRRLAAHWSVIKTFLRFQHPMQVTVTADGQSHDHRTPLIFIARSAFQLDSFGLHGAQDISDDRFAMFIARDGGRAALFRLAWRLIRRRIEVGRDVDYIAARDIVIETRMAKPLVAFDGEKSRMRAPLTFRILPDALDIVVPDSPDPAA